MSQTFSSNLHLSSASVAATAAPLTLVMWVNSTGGQARRFFELCASGADTNLFGITLDVTSASNKVAAYRSSAVTNNQALTSVALTTSAWQHVGAVFAASNSAAAYLNGANKGTSSAGITPTGINLTVISGRQTDYQFGVAGQAAHAAVWARALSDTEMAYLGAGGNPRGIKGCVNYWKVATGESPVIDQIGTNDLTAVGPPGAGSSDPNFETFMVGAAVGDQSYPVGAAIGPINVAGLFDSVSSAYTVTLAQLGAPTQPTTTASALTATREVVVGSGAAFAVGDYMKVTAGGTPTRVLAVNGTTLLVAKDQTYSTAAQVFRFAVNPLTIAGLSITSGSFNGTPTAAAVNSLCFFRATCNAAGSLLADSDLITITTTGGGGGGGGGGAGLQMPAGVFCGGFVGG